MWNLKQIPKICHIYWGGDILPYIRYITVKSFLNLNPEWEIWLWHPTAVSNNITWRSGENEYKLNCKNYLEELYKLPINKEQIDFEKLGFRKSSSEVHKADYIRINALRIYGGVWVDTDIIFFKALEELYFNNPKYEGIDNFIVYSDNFGYSTGFLMAIPETGFYNKLTDYLSLEYNPAHYQSIGPSLFNRYFPKLSDTEALSSTFNMSMEVVYAHNCNQIHELIDGSKARFTAKSIGCHWYGGHPLWGKYLNKTNGGLIKLNNIISNVMDSR